MFDVVFTKGYPDGTTWRLERGRFGIVIKNDGAREAIAVFEVDGQYVCDIVLPVGNTFIERNPVNGKRMYFDGEPTEVAFQFRRSAFPAGYVAFTPDTEVDDDTYKLVAGDWLNWVPVKHLSNIKHTSRTTLKEPTDR